MKRILFFTMLLAVAFCGSSALYAQSAKIDARMNVLASDATNYFNWSYGSENIKDKFDATSGASIAGSTEKFNSVRYDSLETKKAALPVALRGLLLYPISDYKTMTDDNLTVTENGKVLVIHYVHRGTAYELVTDAKGKFDVLTGAKFAKGLADNVGGEFVLKNEYLKAGGDAKKMSDLDWTKITLVPDTKDAAATSWFQGSLDIGLKKGILTVKGTLTGKK